MVNFLKMTRTKNVQINLSKYQHDYTRPISACFVSITNKNCKISTGKAIGSFSLQLGINLFCQS